MCKVGYSCHQHKQNDTFNVLTGTGMYLKKQFGDQKVKVLINKYYIITDLFSLTKD